MLKGLKSTRTKIIQGKTLPDLYHNADYIHVLWDHWAHCGLFENGVLLMYTLEGVSSVANFITASEESQ